AASTAVPLEAILTEVEKSSASQKIVVLDLLPEASGLQSAVGGLSAAAMVDSIRGTRSHPLLKTTPVFAADGTSSPAAGLLSALAWAVSGEADADRDNI